MGKVSRDNPPSLCPGCGETLDWDYNARNDTDHWNVKCLPCGIHVHVQPIEADAPVHVGQEVTLRIQDSKDGPDGVGKVEGFVLFVPDTKAGDVVKVEVTDVFDRFGKAQVTEDLNQDPEPDAGDNEQGAQHAAQ